MAEADGAEDRKPQSDEAHSAFTTPSGMAPEAAEEDQPTSEFAVPDGFATLPVEPEGSAFAHPATYSAHHSPPAHTPGQGFPVTRLKESPWQDRMRTMLRMPVDVRPVPDRVYKQPEDTGPAVGRVLDLTLRIGELLLAGGEAAEDVEAAMFAVARSYGLDRCEPTVTFTMLSITHQPSLVDDPVSASRTVRRRGTDYNRLAAVFRLVDDISTHDDVSLEEAYRRLAEIRRNRHPYPGWMLTTAAGLLAGAASTLVGGGVLVFFAAAIGAVLGDRLAWLCAGRGLPEFYQFVVAAMPPAAIGVALNMTGIDVKASAVITGGLFALLPGRALVAAVQDGLTGYYITASARLLEVMYLFIGIILGVLVVLYVGLQFNDASPRPEEVLQIQQRPLIQIAASMVLVFTFAILLQQERSTVWIVTLNGGIAWSTFGALHYAGGLEPVPSTAIAAGLVGLFGQLFSRYRFASALPYVTAAIGPLLPGSATYYGLLLIAENHLSQGLGSLTNAAAIALAIAIGVNLGSEVSRMFMRIPGAASAAKRRAAKRTRGF
ncbi:threonine/serine exporter ThrE family protein [Streptomyces sp. NPDC058611]|uniref:threonine/serine ThrE exporter family protein n=1 Tax=unclassified Streptomyces TaxID=2593676 RepID=UPI003656C301